MATSNGERSLDPAIMAMRRWRTERGWSAAALAEQCIAFGALLEPPVSSTLTRSRIAKYESGIAFDLKLNEARLLAGVFGISIDEFAAGPGDESAAGPYSSTSNCSIESASPVRTLQTRVSDLEGTLQHIVRALHGAGIQIEPRGQ